MIINGPAKEPPDELAAILRKCGWLSLRPGQIYALFWDMILAADPADADKLMERVMEIHNVATKLGINHTFKTVKTIKMTVADRYPELAR